jgi:hypothetical protein
MNEKNSLTAEQIRLRLDFDDARLLAECDIHTHRVGGPGGQHRNKTETAVRLVHRPSTIVVTAGETRSQHENREVAVWRLREAIAIQTRLPPRHPINWPETVSIRDRRLRVSDRNVGYPHVVGIVLDQFAGSAGEISQAAGAIGVTSSSLNRFLVDHPRVWVAANAIRKDLGLDNLRSSR